MDLQSFYYFSNSIFSIVATIFIVIVSVIAIATSIRVNRFAKRVEEISARGVEVSEEVKNFVSETLERINRWQQSMLTYESAKKLVMEIIETVQKVKERKGSTKTKKTNEEV